MPLTVLDLRCEQQTDPLGVDSPTPRLSWRLESRERGQRQSAYQVLVSSSKERLAADRGDLWDSGRVVSSDQLLVPYAGRKLAPGQGVFWKIRAWDRNGIAGAWSKPGAWEMGRLGNWGAARWIQGSRPAPADPYADDPLPLFSKTFALPKNVKRASLCVTGLGYFEARIGPMRVSDAVLEPGWTNYEKRVFYRVFDVAKLLKRGENEISILVGNGWWNPLPLQMFGGAALLTKSLPTGRPRCIAHLEIELEGGSRQTVVTDESWIVNDSYVRFQNNYLGEWHDYREFGKSYLRPVALATEPVGPLLAEPQPPIRVREKLKHVSVTERERGVWIFDFGVNGAGRVRQIEVTDTKPGQKITLRYGELLHKDGSLNPMTGVCGQIKGGSKERQGAAKDSERPEIPAVQQDVYVCMGYPEEIFAPKFGFRGFRYVEVRGATARPEILAEHLSSDVESAGEFSCSEPLLNEIQTVCQRTFLSNLFSVQSDCPHREKFGYGGDIVATRDAFLMNFDMAALYAKIATDYADAARTDGSLPDTAPFVGLQYCGVGWPMALPLLLDELRRYHGDLRTTERNYDAVARWLASVEAKYGAGLVTDGLTDHEARAQTPPEPTLTLLYAECLKLGARLAESLGKRRDAARLLSRAEKVLAAYRRAFPEPPPTQTALAYALEYGPLSDAEREKVLARTLADLKAQNGLTTGIFGTKFLLDSLSRLGKIDVAYALATKKTVPSWGAMLAGGATTLWEHWEFSDNTYSHNHPMFGSISAWLFHWLAGIQPEKDAVGFDKIALRPQFPQGLSWGKASYRSARGPISVRWKRSGNRALLDISIPVGCSATLALPDGKIKALESGRHRVSAMV